MSLVAELVGDGREPLGMRLLRKEHGLRRVAFAESACRVLYAPGAPWCMGLAPEECVVACGQQVVWTAGGAVRKRFTAGSEVLQLCWVHFSNTYSSSRDGGTSSEPAGQLPGWQTPGAGGAPQANSSAWAGATPGAFPVFGGAAAAVGGSSTQRPPHHPAAASAGAASQQQAATARKQPGSKHAQQRVSGAGKQPAADRHAASAAAGSTHTFPQGADAVTGAVLCLLHGSSITCLFPTGEVLETPLLQPCQALWPVPGALLLAGPCDAFVSVLTHPLEEPLPVVADCSISSPSRGGGGGGGAAGASANGTAAAGGRGGRHISVAALAGWCQERVVWSSRQLPVVATYNEERGRLSVWHMRTQPSGTAALGSSFDLPALSPAGLPGGGIGTLRTPPAPALAGAGVASAAGAVSAGGALPATFGSAGTAATAAAVPAANWGCVPAAAAAAAAAAARARTAAAGSTAAATASRFGAGSASAAATAAAAAAAAGYGCGPAAYSGSMLGRLAGGGSGTPWTAASSVARASGGTGTVRRPSLRSPAGALPASVFNATPHPLNAVTGALGALGPLRPAFSNTTAAQQALLLPGPDPTLLFKLLWQQELHGGAVPASAVLASDGAGAPLLCVLCPGAAQLLALQLPADPGPAGAHPVKQLFSLPALAAAPIHTRFVPAWRCVAPLPCSTRSSASASASQHHAPVVDLLVLHPQGRLQLFRGAVPLLHVSLQLPNACLQHQASADAAAHRAAAGQQQGRSPGSIGARSMSECDGGSDGGDDMEVLTSPGSVAGDARATSTQQRASDAAVMAAAAPAPALTVTGLRGAVGDRVDVELALSSGAAGHSPGSSSTAVRVRVGLSWLPGLPTQALQALCEVLPADVHSRLLAAALQQPHACCGQLAGEWRTLASVLLAWALDPAAITPADPAAGARTPRLQTPGSGAGAVGGVALAGFGSDLRGRDTAAATAAATATPGTAGDTAGADDMEMATPAAARTPLQQQQQPQAVVATPGSDMSVSMSLDSASFVTGAAAAAGVGPPASAVAAPRGTRKQQQPGAGTPMSVCLAGTPMSVTSKTVSRLRQHTPSALHEQQSGAGARRSGLRAAGSDADTIFPTPVQLQAATGEQQRQPQQQQEQAPGAAWQQLLQSHSSKALLRQLPCLVQQQQPCAAGSATAAHPVAAHAQQQPTSLARLPPQQLQQHRHGVAAALLALHAVYEDCKLCRLTRRLLPLLGPVCWALACWMGAARYAVHYERDCTPAALAAGAAAYVQAACRMDGGSGSTGSSSETDSAGRLLPVAQLAMGAGTPSPAAGACSDAAPGAPLLLSLLQQAPGDMLHCLRALLAASDSYRSHLPHLAAQGSSAVLRSCQLVQAYEVLADGARQCAAAMLRSAAAAVAQGERAASSDTIMSEGPSAQQQGMLPWLPACADSRGASGCEHTQQAALAAELSQLLLASSQRLVLLLVAQGWDAVSIAQLPLGVALPLKEALARSRSNPPAGWPVMAYALIGREDIAATLTSNSGASAAAPAAASVTSSSTQAPVVGQSPPGGQHLLLPHELRLLLPAASLLTGLQHHRRPPPPSSSSAAGGAAAGGRRAVAAGGLRSVPGSLAGGAAGAAGSGSGGSGGGGSSSSEWGVPVDGMEGLVDGVSALRFSRDGRLAEARQLLATNMPVLLTVSGSESDPELHAKQQAALFACALRTMALPLGRGALMMGLAQPLPGEQLVVPLLCLSGVVPGPAGDPGGTGRTLINLDLSNAQPAADVTAWCEFHNGVASGLKIAPYQGRRRQQRQQHQQAAAAKAGGSDGSGSSSSALDWGCGGGGGGGSLADSWLPHSKPAVPNYAHAGVLLALGLTGHLDRLSWTDLYRYLSDQHDATTIAVLLGMSACCRGAADSTVARMLFLHLPARHPNTFPEIEMSPHVQAAALLSLGLLYQGSCHRLVTETMLQEVARSPGASPNVAVMCGGDMPAGGASLAALASVTQDREGYALAAGFGLGLTCLGQGRNAPGLADLHLEDRLRNLMDAQVQPHVVSKQVAQAPLPGVGGSSGHPRNLLDSVLGAGVVTWDAHLCDDPTGQAGGGGGGSGGQAGAGGLRVDPEQMQQYGISQVVLEGPVVNTAVTGPAAAVALMLMYLKTGDADVAACFKVPDTAYALDHVCPGMVLLMVLGRALVLWDGIVATQEWLEAQLPPLLNQAAAATAAGGAAAAAQQAGVDWAAAALARVHALAGGCLAIGLRFAGTSNAQAEALLRSQLLSLLAAKRKAPGGSTHGAVAAAAAAAAAAVAAGGAPGSSVGVGMVPPAAAAVGVLDRLALEDAICSVLLSLCLVMAGTGHLPTFRLVQLLSRRAAALPTRPQQAAAPEEAAPPGSAPSIAAMLGGPGLGTTSLHFGHHLAVSLAGGLLFLSGGRASLSTSNEALAALLIALYPTWPTTPTDQRCHLQAFRHLYALAAEPRCLEALDVHSRRQVVAPVHVTASTEGLLGAAACGSARSRQRPPHTQLTQQQQAQQAQQGGKGVARPAVQQQQQQQHVPAAGVLAGVQVSAVAAHTPPVKPGLAPVSPAATAGAGGGGAGQEPSGAATADAVGSVCTALTQLRLQAPCLLPERRHLVSLSVCGPRYWTVHVAAAAGAAGVRAADAAAGASSVGGGGAGSWSQQHLRQRICVKKKAGSLSYTDDTSGVRSLLFRAFYAGGSGGGALPGQAAGASAGDHGAGGADKEDAAAAGSAAGGGGSSSSSQAEQRSFDIVHLCQTFAADPQVQGFAQLLQAAGRAASGAAGSGSSGGGGMSAAVRFVTFCHSVLYECVVQEKTSMLPVYLQLYCQVLHACADAHSLQPAAGGGRMRPRAGAGLLLPRDAEGSAPLVPSTTQGSSVALQDLLTVQALYGSSTAVAAEVCRSAVDSGVAGSAAAPHGDPEPWQALLQPGFCDSLGSALLQAWRHAGVAPAHSGSSVNGGSLVEAYARLRSISAAVGAADDGVQAVLAACLAAHGGVGGGAAAL